MVQREKSLRGFLGWLVGAVVLVVAAAAFGTMWHYDKSHAALNSPSGVVNGKPVADSTASD